LQAASTPRRCVWNEAIEAAEEHGGQLQPLEGASGTLISYLPILSAGRFNPSKVRLERSTSPPPTKTSPRFNPSKVRLELRFPSSVDPAVDASTPRRCVWNVVLVLSRSLASVLQPLEGASGTRPQSDPVEVLQLQPLEGASGTIVPQRRQRRLRQASTPRRCV